MQLVAKTTQQEQGTVNK